MWSSMNANASSSSSSTGMSGLFSAAPAAAAAPAIAPVQAFKFNFSAADDDDDAAMQDGTAEAEATSAKTAAAVPAPLQRKAVQHQPSASAAAAPSSTNDVELLTLHASSTFSVSAVDATPAAASSSSSSSSAAAAASAPLALRFLKRRSVGAHTALKDLLNESDIITQVYEGGFKVWECAIDLILFLHRHSSAAPLPASSPLRTPLFSRGFSNVRVAELGCGHGFPAIFCLQRGAPFVALQDYNDEVIDTASIDNARLNLREYAPTASSSSAAASSPASAAAVESELSRRCGFFSGDWSDPLLLEMMRPASYDLILTSDTLYSSAYMAPLFSAISSLLAPAGIALVAAKRYYFGIGGSTMEFKQLVHDQGKGEWECTLVDTIEDGKSNIREILMIRRKGQQAQAAQ